MTFDDISREAELLPEAERIQLVDRLIATLADHKPASERRSGSVPADGQAFPNQRVADGESLADRLGMAGGPDFEFDPPKIEIGLRIPDFS